ncbi:MAG: DUF4398 domain-containing protein [Chromatiales bacterium]|nr:DUF4398 domain-containing protein [Chromatiales bacterium]
MRTASRFRSARRSCAATGLMATALLMTACAASPVAPTSSLDAARTAIANAERANAGSFAAAELDAARQKMIQADRAAAGKTQVNMVRADRLAQEARVEAELAAARTEAAKAAAVNRELNLGADALTEEMKRAGEQK